MSGRLYISTFGCQMNAYDSARMADVLRESEGLELTGDPEEAAAARRLYESKGNVVAAAAAARVIVGTT